MALEQMTVKTYHSADFASHLRVPEGIDYIEPHYEGEIREALENGKAVYVESYEGRAFVWPADGRFQADLFFTAEPMALSFDSLVEAVDWASTFLVGGGNE